jgi:D-3-phosphoglycerate dehydrogenase
MARVLITDTVHEEMLRLFEEAGHEVTYLPHTNPSEVEKMIATYEALVINSKIKVDRALIDWAVKLKVVGRLGSGREVIDESYAQEKGIAFFTAPEGNCDAVAEQAMGMLLSLLHKVNVAAEEVKQHQWLREKNRGTELMGKKIGIIGYGHTGAAFAKRMRGFDVRILVYDKYKSGFSDEFVQESDMETIFNETDILSLHLPLTEDTKRLVDKKFLNKFSKNIYLINTSRGVIVPLEDLMIAIDSGKVLGAALDVLENEALDSYNEAEQLLFNRLISLNNVIITPHIAGWTFESKRRIAEILSVRMISHLKGIEM